MASDDRLRVWDVATGRLKSSLTMRANFHRFSSDARFLAAWTGEDARFNLYSVWDVTSGKRLRQFKGRRTRVSDLAISPDGLRAGVGREDGE
ncbi:hypothetical protein LZ199_04340 [Myxococcus sp. QH3KD-4-1]|nr:hypothetical protein [Myxococcus qinghaiensis]